MATNAGLSKPQARKLAQLAQHGFVKGLSPAHTLYDGDTMFAASTGSLEADPIQLGITAAELVAESLGAAVKSAGSAGGVPGLGGG